MFRQSSWFLSLDLLSQDGFIYAARWITNVSLKGLTELMTFLNARESGGFYDRPVIWTSLQRVAGCQLTMVQSTFKGTFN